MQDFNNEQIKNMFGKQVNSMEQKKLEALQQSHAERAALSLRMEQFREQNKQVQSNLDHTIESLEDKFTDSVNVVEYDAQRLESEYLSGGKTIFKNKAEIPCLSVRSSVAACLREHTNNVKACDSAIEALEDCAGTAIANK